MQKKGAVWQEGFSGRKLKIFFDTLFFLIGCWKSEKKTVVDFAQQKNKEVRQWVT